MLFIGTFNSILTRTMQLELTWQKALARLQTDMMKWAVMGGGNQRIHSPPAHSLAPGENMTGKNSK